MPFCMAAIFACGMGTRPDVLSCQTLYFVTYVIDRDMTQIGSAEKCSLWEVQMKRKTERLYAPKT